MDKELLTDPLEEVEAPEAETEDKAPESTDSQEAEAEESQPRDEAGRYAEKVDQPPEQVETPSDEAPSTQTDTDGVQVARPFSYNADQRTYEVPGATVGEDGALSIPGDQAPHIQQLLSAGRHHMGNWQQERQGYQQQVTAAQAEAAAAQQSKDALTAELARVAQMDEQARLEWVEGFAGNWPTIQANSEKVAIESKHQADQERLRQYEQQEQVRQLEPQVNDGLWTYMIAEQEKDPRFKDLDKEDGLAIHARLFQDWQSSGILITPDQQPWRGEGTPNIDLRVVRREMEYAATLRRRREQQEKTTAKAVETNKAELAEPKTPPAVSTQTGPPPADAPARKRFKPSTDDPERMTEEADDHFFG
jgi:hypothetical protein